MASDNALETDFFIIALKEEARAALWEVGSAADPDTLIKSVLHELQALAPNVETDPNIDKEVWTEIKKLLVKAAYKTRPRCIRCGTCCSKGSPTLVGKDLHLFTKNTLKPSEVATIRKGEPAYSNRTEEIVPSEIELIKIKETDNSRTCIFYDQSDKACTIYDVRPQQCRDQECWNSESMTERETGEPLTRADLLSRTGALWDIIQKHEERCSFPEFSRAMSRLSATQGQTVEDVMEFLKFDHHVREFLKENFSFPDDTMVFLLGRPLSELLPVYGLKLEHNPDGTFFLTLA